MNCSKVYGCSKDSSTSHLTSKNRLPGGSVCYKHIIALLHIHVAEHVNITSPVCFRSTSTPVTWAG